MFRGVGVTMVRAFIGKVSYLLVNKVNAVTFYGYEWAKNG
jgi:hypothetical protein